MTRAGSFCPILRVPSICRDACESRVGLADALALAFGQPARAVHGAVLAVRDGPALLDALDQPGGAVGDDQHRRAEPAGDQVATELEPVLVRLAHAEHHREQHPLVLLGEPPGDQHALLHLTGVSRFWLLSSARSVLLISTCGLSAGNAEGRCASAVPSTTAHARFSLALREKRSSEPT